MIESVNLLIDFFAIFFFSLYIKTILFLANMILKSIEKNFSEIKFEKSARV